MIPISQGQARALMNDKESTIELYELHNGTESVVETVEIFEETIKNYKGSEFGIDIHDQFIFEEMYGSIP